MILSLRTTRKHVAAARSDGNLAAPVTCAIVPPTKRGVPDLTFGPKPFDAACKKIELRSCAVEPLQPCSVISAIFLQEATMNGIIYLIGLIVVILAILSFFGLR